MGAREAAEIAFRGTHVIPATPEGAPVSSKPMRYRDSEGDIWETVPGSHGDDLMDEGGGVCSYGYVLSQYGPLTLVHDDEPAEEAEDTPVVGEVYESPEELAAEVVRLRTDNASLTAARDRARRDRDDWREAYNTLCSDLAYEMGMEDASIAGDRQVKARVADLVKESARAYSRGVEDMRSAAMAALRKSEAAEWLLAGAPAGADAARIVRDVPIAREGAEPLRRCDVGMSAGPCAKPLNHDGRCRPDDPSDMVASRIVEEEREVQQRILKDPTNPALAGLLTGLQRARDIATDTATATPAPREAPEALLAEYKHALWECGKAAGREGGDDPDHILPLAGWAVDAVRELRSDYDEVDAMVGQPAAAPRDTDLIQQVRALVKRYGAPAIAAEAARQAKHH